MARKKRRARFTVKKKYDKKKTPDALSDREFAALSQDYGSFIAEDQNHQQQIYHLDETVYMRWQASGDEDPDTDDIDRSDLWIGKICQIRGDGSQQNVWIRVQWYWSPYEVAEAVKSFDPTICGKYEKLFSTTLDIVTPHCVVDRVQVKRFDEMCMYQEHIEDKEWYYRYEFSYEGRRITPKVTHTACPICKIPYTPGGIDKILHFCPKLTCSKFYHQACLVKNGYSDAVHRTRLLETWPDITRTESVEEVVCRGASAYARKRLKGAHGQRVVSRHAPPESEDPLAAFPPLLVSVADQPILRGYPGGGIVGNIVPVTAARVLIYKVLAGCKDIPENWECMIDAASAFVELEDLPCCYCPSCYSPI